VPRQRKVEAWVCTFDLLTEMEKEKDEIAGSSRNCPLSGFVRRIELVVLLVEGTQSLGFAEL
jgi:hypothetical protein